jgi:hypothetical protein
MDSSLALRYRLPRSVIVVDGHITTRKDPATLAEHHSAVADVAVQVQADPDPDATASLSLERDFWKSRDLEIGLTPDGRLHTLSTTTTGAGGAVVSGVVRLGTFAASLATTLLVKGEEEDLEKAYAADNDPEIVQVRKEMREALTDLQLRFAALAKTLADPATATDARTGAHHDLRAVSTAIAAVRAEAEELNSHFRAWVESRSGTSEEKVSVTLDTTALAEREHADRSVTIVLNELPATVREVADRLGIVPMRIADGDDRRFTSQDAEAAGGAHTVVLRLPRAYTLAVYELEPVKNDADDTLRNAQLKSVLRLWVLDDRCALAAVPLDSSLFSKQTAAIEFADTGALTRVTSAASAGAQAVSDALAAAAETATKSAEQAKGLLSTLDSLQDRRAEEHLADLQREKASLEAEIEVKGVLAGRADRERLSVLQSQLDVAKAARALGTEAVAAKLDARTRELRQQLEIANLKNELAKVQPTGG